VQRHEGLVPFVWISTGNVETDFARRTSSTMGGWSVGSPPESVTLCPFAPALRMAASTASSPAAGRCVDTKQKRHA
jgi:hypothetical protein